MADEQVGEIITSLTLPDDWLDRALERLSLHSEVDRVEDRRHHVQQQLRRLGQAYVDGLFADGDYSYQKRTMELELESLVIPEADAAEEAGKLVTDLPRLWAGANLEERRKLVLAVFDAVYVDTKTRSVVRIKPKPAFRAVLEVAKMPLLTADSGPTVSARRVLRPSL